MRNRIYLVTVTLLLSLFFQCTTEVQTLRNGEESLNFKSQLMNGEEVNLADFRGDYVLLHFWGSWCAPCRKRNPKWIELYDTFHNAKFKKAKNFEIISIGLEKDEEVWKAAIEADKLPWEYQLLELEDSTNVKAQKIANLYQIKQVPSSYLINPKGIIIGVNLSPDEITKLLKRQIGIN